MRFITPRLLLLLPMSILLLAAACGGGDDDGETTPDPTILTPLSGAYIPTVISSDLAVGENRFILGLLDQDQLPIAGAQLRAEFVRDEAGSSIIVAEANLIAITVQRSSAHLHEDGEQHLRFEYHSRL